MIAMPETPHECLERWQEHQVHPQSHTQQALIDMSNNRVVGAKDIPPGMLGKGVKPGAAQ